MDHLKFYISSHINILDCGKKFENREKNLVDTVEPEKSHGHNENMLTPQRKAWNQSNLRSPVCI